MARISVILAIYNMESTIIDTMHSLLTQTAGDLEIIMVDAGSEDGTYEVCSGYLAMYSNVKVIQVAQHGNLSMARNVGLKMAEGSYVFFAQGGVVYENDALEKLCMPMREHQIDIAYGYFGERAECEKQMQEFVKGYQTDEKKTREWFLQYFPDEFILNLNNKMFRRELLMKKEIKFISSPSADRALFLLRYMQHVRNMVIVPERIVTGRLPKDRQAPAIFDWDMEKKVTIEYYRLAESWKYEMPQNKRMVLYFQEALVRHLQAVVLLGKNFPKPDKMKYYAQLAEDPWVHIMLSGEVSLGGFGGTVLGLFSSAQYMAMEGMLAAKNQVLGYKKGIKQIFKKNRNGD